MRSSERVGTGIARDGFGWFWAELVASASWLSLFDQAVKRVRLAALMSKLRSGCHWTPRRNLGGCSTWNTESSASSSTASMTPSSGERATIAEAVAGRGDGLVVAGVDGEAEEAVDSGASSRVSSEQGCCLCDGRCERWLPCFRRCGLRGGASGPGPGCRRARR